MAERGEISEFIANLRLTDHHCHGLAADPPSRETFEMLAADSAWPPPAGQSIFDSPIGLAIRHYCAPMLGLPANDSAESYWRRRAGLGHDAGPLRLTDPVVLRHILHRAVELAKPLQFHVGFGDADVTLYRCDPTRMTEFIRATFRKILFSSDAFGLPELYACGTAMWRRAMSRIFGEWLDEGLISLSDARRYAEWVGSANADRVYGPGAA